MKFTLKIVSKGLPNMIFSSTIIGPSSNNLYNRLVTVSEDDAIKIGSFCCKPELITESVIKQFNFCCIVLFCLRKTKQKQKTS